MRRHDVEAELGHQPLQAGDLPLRELHHQPRQRSGVDDRMLERALQAATDEPRVERVVAVLDEHSTLSEPQERSPCVLENRRADEHRAIDVMAPLRIRVDGRAAVDERVEEGERLVEGEALGAELEDKKRRVAGGLHVQGDELRLLQRCERANLRCVDRDLLPGHRCGCTPRLEIELRGAHRARRRARRANAISSLLATRRSRHATAYTTTPAAIGIRIITPPRLLIG